jgi:hypothetical protein
MEITTDFFRYKIVRIWRKKKREKKKKEKKKKNSCVAHHIGRAMCHLKVAVVGRERFMSRTHKKSTKKRDKHRARHTLFLLLQFFSLNWVSGL